MNDVFPTADLVACAIIAAAKQRGLDPIDVMTKADMAENRARLYALNALIFICRDVRREVLGRLVGGSNKHLLVKLSGARGAAWWCPTLAATIVADAKALYARFAPPPAPPKEPEPVKAEPPVPAIVTEKPAPPPVKAPPPVVVTRRLSLTPLRSRPAYEPAPYDCGDPPPARSELARRLAEGTI